MLIKSFHRMERMKKKATASIFFIFIFLFISLSGFSNTELSDVRVYVLCYHAFLDRKDPYSLTEEVFKEQLEALKAGGFNFISMADIKSKKLKGDKNILVTIDDGNKSTYPAFFNILKPMGIKPMLGIYPAIIGRTDYALTWEQLKELSDEGCYVAAHGYNHLYVNEKAWNESQAQFKREIYLPKKRLQEKLGIEVDTFIYPFGVKSPQAIEELQKAGYKYAFTIIPQKTKIPFKNNFEIPRFLITKGNIKSFTAKVTSAPPTAKTDKSKNTKSSEKNVSKSSLKNTKKVIEEKIKTVKTESKTIKNFIVNDIVVLPKAIKGDKKKIKPDAELIKPENKPVNLEYDPFESYISSSLTNNSVNSNSVKHSFKSFFTDLKKSYFAISARFRFMINEITVHALSRFNEIKNSGLALIKNYEKPQSINEK